MSGTPPRIVRQETKNKITTCKTPLCAVFFYFYRGRANCAICEMMKSKNYCGSGKKLKNFLDVHYNFFDI